MLGGIGLGVGYLTPVSTLVKWFPDRRGLAVGMAIMGFGFSAMIFGPVMQFLFGSVGPTIVTRVQEATGNYAATLYVFAGLFIVALVVTGLMAIDIRACRRANAAKSLATVGTPIV